MPSDQGESMKHVGSKPGKASMGSGSWLGAGVRVLKSVTIGPGAVLAAGRAVAPKAFRQYRTLAPEGEVTP